MKKLALAILALGSALTASAQSKTTFGISGGVNFAKIAVSVDGSSMSGSTGSLTSFSAGVFADAPVGSNVSIQPGLYYTGKGGKISSDGESIKAKLNYIQLPVNVVYNAYVSAGKFFFGAGPYAAVALNGKSEYSASGNSGSVSEDIEFGSGTNATHKRTDFGVTGLVGFTFKNGLLLKLNTDLGLANTLNNNSFGEKNKNRVTSISVGYTF